MNHKFKYNIETLATQSVKRFETHVEIEHLGNSTSFFSGLYCTPDTYTNFKRKSFSLSPVHYGFHKCFWFGCNWIEVILYDFYIQSLLDPNTLLLKGAEQKIKRDIDCLNEFQSFNYSMRFFLLDRFLYHDDEEQTYADYAPYYRLLDCILDYQLRTRTILTKNSNNKIEFFESIREYVLQGYKFRLTEELKVFLQWSIENYEALVDEQELKWISDI